MFIKYDTLIDKIQIKNKKRKLEKLLSINKSYICIYINFLISYLVFDPLNSIINQKIISFFQEEFASLPINDHQLKENIHNLFELNYTIIIRVIVIKNLSRKLISIHESFSTTSSDEMQTIANIISTINQISSYLNNKSFFPENLLFSKNVSQNTIKSMILFIKHLK